MKSKKSTIGSTIVWISAIFIILIILLGYLLFSSYIYKSKGPSKLSLLTGYSGFASTALTAFLDILKTPGTNGKSIMDDLEAGDTASFKEKIVRKSGGDVRNLLGVECFYTRLYLNDRVVDFAGNVRGGAGYSEDKYRNIYIPTDKGSMIKINFYGGKCL